MNSRYKTTKSVMNVAQKALFLCLGLFIIGQAAFADGLTPPADNNRLAVQAITVSGAVTDANTGETLPGVNILVKGQNKGTSTDADGRYRLTVEDQDVLVFSYIGYKTQEVPVNGRPVINVQMTSDSKELKEIVVVGYGQQQKEALTGSVSTIDEAKLEQVPTTSFESTLQGSMAGVQMVSTDGAPGSNTQIRIRGIGSITASSSPLYVVDGVIMTSGSVADLNDNGGRSTNVMAGINPNDIASISVLKDAASTAIYGSRGANGVILITTKSGKSGKPQISLKTQVGVNLIANNNFYEPLNAAEYKQLYLEGYVNRGETMQQAQTRFDNTFSQLTDPETGNPTDTNWLDSITRTGKNQSYDLSVSGGTDDVRYYVSAAYFDQQSYVIGTDFDRLSSRANLDIKINDYLSISNNLNISNTNQNGMTDGSAWANPLYNAFLLSPLIPIRDASGRFNAEHKNYFPMGGNNPVGALSGDDSRNTKQLRLIDNFALNVELLDNLKFRSQWNVDVIQVAESQYKNPRYGDGRNSGGYAQVNEIANRSWVGTQTLDYLVDIDRDNHIEALAGFEAQKTTRNDSYGYGENFPNPKLVTLSSAAEAYEASASETAYAFMSVFSRFNYDYKSKYFLSASIRRDGSSRFGADKRWGTFYSVGAAWGIHNEKFLSDVSFVDMLKLRASYGTTGNAAIGNFPSRGLYGFGYNYDGSPGGRPTQIANPLLTWESQQNFNVGVDFGFLSRVTGTVEYFSKVSSDLLLDVPISRTTGFSDLTQNFGEMKNSGVEVTLEGTIINNDDFSWRLGLNTTFIKNKITKLEEDYIDGTKIRQEGSDYMNYYLYEWAGVDQTNGDPLWYTDESRTTTTNNINNAERMVTGKSATPDHYGGLNTSFFYKGFALDAQFTYSWGNSVYDLQERFLNADGALTPRSTTKYAFENRWLPGKTDAKLPMHKWGGNNTSNVSNSSRWLYDGSYVRLRNVTLAYNFTPQFLAKFGARSLRVYTKGTNLLTFTRDPNLHVDPEQNVSGNSNSLTPAIRSITVGFDIGF